MTAVVFSVVQITLRSFMSHFLDRHLLALKPLAEIGNEKQVSSNRLLRVTLIIQQTFKCAEVFSKGALRCIE